METVISILMAFLKGITAYTVIISLFFLLPGRRLKPAAKAARFAVLIAARNEEAVIRRAVHSMLCQNYPADRFDVYVIPNNCTDCTETAARQAGARILLCREPVRNKGDALRQALNRLMCRYDAYCIFDADNRADENFLARMNDAIASGAEAAKGRQVALNPYDSWVSGCYDLYFAHFHLLYNRPRARLGLSAKLVGTGFMITDTLLHRLGGWNTCTMTEDAEFAAQCALAGVRVHYVPEALTYDEQPVSFSVSLRQRRRWSAGVMDVANAYLPRLIRSAPSPLRIDYSIFLFSIYAQLLALIPAVFGLFSLSAAALLMSAVSFYSGLVITALFLSLSACRKLRPMLKSILLYPLFTASWYPLHLLSLFSKPNEWKPIPHGRGTHLQSAKTDDPAPPQRVC